MEIYLFDFAFPFISDQTPDYLAYIPSIFNRSYYKTLLNNKCNQCFCNVPSDNVHLLISKYEMKMH